MTAPPIGQCKIHGEQFYLFSKKANGWLCAGCVAQGFYVPDITKQIEDDYPLEMKSARAGIAMPGAVMAKYPGSDPT